MKSLKALMVCAALVLGACDGLAPQGSEPTASQRACPAAVSGETCDAPLTAMQSIQYGPGPYYCSMATNCPAAEYAECKDNTCMYRACSVGPTAAACPVDRPMCDTSVTPTSCKGTAVSADSPTPPVFDGGVARLCMLASECVTTGTTDSDWLCRFTTPGCAATDKGVCVKNRELVCRNDYQEYCGCDGVTLWDYRQASDCSFKQYRSVGACPVVDGGVRLDGGVVADGGTPVLPDAGVTLDGGTVAVDGGVIADGGTSVLPDAGVNLEAGLDKVVYRANQAYKTRLITKFRLILWRVGINLEAAAADEVSFKFPSPMVNNLDAIQTGDVFQIKWLDASGNAVEDGCGRIASDRTTRGVFGEMEYSRNGVKIRQNPATDGGLATVIVAFQGGGDNCLVP